MSRFLDHDWFPEPLPENVFLAERSWLYSSFAFRHYRSRRPLGLRVGHDTGLYNGTFFNLGPDGEVVIGNFCTLVGAIINSNCRIEISDYVFIAHEVVIADTDWGVPSTARLVKQQALKATKQPRQRSIVIGENVWIGTRAVICGDAQIGEGAIIGAAAVVNFNVPPYCVAAGNPATIVKRL